MTAGFSSDRGGLPTESMTLNIGPSHPATHGAIRVAVELDGETIVKAVPEIGYLHRAFEKHAEMCTWNQVIPYTDRLNYCSSLMNNVGYAKAVEDLLGITIPERAQMIRVIVAELSRIIDHLVCIAAAAVDVGALTNYWYFFNVREKAYDEIERMCGARLTTAYTRVGGLYRDVPPDFAMRIRDVLNEMNSAIRDVTKLLERNRIFIDRTCGVGVITKEEAISYGFTGPCLRASGVPYDVRLAKNYYHYDEFDFEAPVRENGDTYDRLMIRIDEMRESAKIVEQALDRLPDGPICVDDPRISYPPKDEVYGSIEGLVNQFMLVMDGGIRPPKGEVYSATEAANGELGFYIVSDGGPRPYRVRCRPPCLPLLSAYPHLVEGHMVADAVVILSSLNIIVGEMDR